MRTVIAALLVTLASAGGAAAAIPWGLSDDPLDRGALLALPSVYRVDAVLHVDGLRTASGERITLPPRFRTIRESGTAVAVAQDGWLVTAAHVAAPDDDTLARLAYQQSLAVREQPHGDDVAEAWVAREGAVPVGGRVVSVTVTPAQVEPSPVDVRVDRALDVRRSETADLALVRIGARMAPALELDEAASSGTPIVTIGFGRGSTLDAARPGPLEPAIRRGAIRRTGLLGPKDDPTAQRQAIVISAPVERGDSGGPVVDAAGRLRGIVTIKSESGGIAELATEVRQLLEENGLAPSAGPAADAFRGAMQALWGLDLPAAESGFDATLAAFPRHTLAARERTRAEELQESSFALRGGHRLRGGLLAVGIIALVAALACGLALLRPPQGRARGGAGGQ